MFGLSAEKVIYMLLSDVVLARQQEHKQHGAGTQARYWTSDLTRGSSDRICHIEAGWCL